jgi:protein TonB
VREIKKSINTKWNSKLYFQLSLIACLLMAYCAIQTKFEVKEHASVIIKDSVIEELPLVTYSLEQPISVKSNNTPLLKKIKVPRVIENVKKVVHKSTKEIKTVSNMNPSTKNISDLENDNKETKIKEKKSYNFLGVEHVPVFPGCENYHTNFEKRNCMSENIKKFIQRKFNTDRFEGLLESKTHTIYVQFFINERGEVAQIKARSREKRLEKEAIRVISKLPKMQPGIQGDKKVKVQYGLPITFKIE